MGFDLSQINKRLLHLIEIRKNLTNTYERNLKELNDEIAIEQNNLKRVSEILSPYICRYCGGSGDDEGKFSMAVLDAAKVIKRICNYIEKHGTISLACGAEWMYQDDDGQVDALELVGCILDDLEDYMATVLSLKSSPLLSEEKIETVFNTRDFMYLVDKYMGYDAMRYFRELVEDYDETINNLNCEIKEMIQEAQTAHE